MRPLSAMTWPGEGVARRPTSTAASPSFPCAYAHSSRGKEAIAWPSSADRFGPSGEAVHRPRLSVAIEAAIGAAH